ncbi:MAG: NO-inducible flavohemoprotein [Desulfovibrio sp.]|nr:NO-inducible flavohemoprotein [Desulfovibrio sp.]
MVTPRQKELVKATVPVLREHGVALISHFYKRMLHGNPELKNIFNQAHQAEGHQQRALASAVLAYAENIDDLSPLLPAVRHIAIKHCTIGIRAEQYGIVGRHLLASIKEVLGEAATDELVDAWAAAYGSLAKVLIDAENAIYEEQAMTDGGWSGWRPFVVDRRVQESADVTSFYLRPADGGALPVCKPGQFVSVRTFLSQAGLAQPRQYTVSSVAHEGCLRISVKRVPATAAAPAGMMSNHLHDSLQVGDSIDVSAPLGDFTLAEGSGPVVLMAAGIGITPMLAMLGSIVKNTPERSVDFFMVCQDCAHFPLKAEVEQAMASLKNGRLHLFYTRAKGEETSQCRAVRRLMSADLESLPVDADWYICGPVSFMHQQIEALKTRGIAAERIHYEIFGTGSMSQ